MLMSDVPVRCIDSSPQENAGVFCRLPSSQHFFKSPFAVDFTSAMAATLLTEKPGEQPAPAFKASPVPLKSLAALYPLRVHVTCRIPFVPCFQSVFYIFVLKKIGAL